ncbi:MAG: MMPL family transporter [Tissierellia bacterium]|nr:MMPL family transporter [Tissierellia bacterium]
MLNLTNFIVKQKKLIIFLYIILSLLAFIGSRFVEVNYDLSLYLPQSLNSIEGKNILEEEFGIGGTAYVLIKDESFNEIENLIKDIETIAGIKEVIWLGTVEDIFKPEDFMDENIKKEFLSENSNLIQIHFSNPNDSLETVEGVEEIQNILGEKGVVGGPAAVSKDLQYITSKEVIYYSLVAFVIISIILFLSLESFIEPILFFIAIGVAIILNMGTNIVFDNISYTTHSVAAIIQLAVSMDYSIFLLHRYMEEKENHRDNNQAMIVAIEKTFNSVLSSSMTTVAGFLALIVMKYTIGRDIGLVLAKGVLFSLISVMTLLPVLILLFDKAIEKYKHKVFLPSFNKLANFIIRRKYVLLIIGIIIAIPSYLAQSNVKYYYANEKVLPETSDSNMAIREINQLFSNKNQLALLLPKGDKLKENQLTEELKNIEGVGDVKGMYSMVDIVIPETFIPEDVKENFQSKNYSLININLNLPMEGDITKDSLNQIKTKVSNYYDKWYLTGESAIYSDLQETTAKDFRNVSILSIVLITSIILIAFKSISIPIILVFIIELGIWINLAIPYIQGKILNFISFIIIGAIQLGATVDYAILFTSRYRENLEKINDRNKAAIETIVDTGRPILTSALILFTGTFSVYLITSMTNAKELTLLIGRGAIISLILVLMVLPSLLIIFHKVISISTINWPKINNTGGE